MQEFTRNPEVELAAVNILHYTPDQVKRKTIASLQKELNEPTSLSGQQMSPTSQFFASNKKKVSFSPTLTNGARRFEDDCKSHSNESESLDLDDIAALEEMLEKQKRIQQIIDEDSDFDEEDRRDWKLNINSTVKKIEKIQRLGKARQERERQERERQERSVLAKWRRKQKKLKELEDTGLIEPMIAKKWAAKQEKIANEISSRQK